jgi:hypothetical protein
MAEHPNHAHAHQQRTTWGGALWAAADLVTPMAIRVAATLRVADHIAGGVATTDGLAAAADVDADALGRVLAHLVTAGVLTRDGDTFALTELGEGLRDGHPDGIRPWLDLEGAVGRADLCFVQMLHTVRTGEPAYPRQFGRTYWEDLSADEALATTFDDLMGARLVSHGPAIAGAYDWASLGDVVDVGGADGSLLIALLQVHQQLRGTVVDLPGVVGRAGVKIAAAGLADRADAVEGSFFDALPAGAGGYVLSGVLHDWDDEDALRILRRCAEAAGDTGKVLVVDHVDDPGHGGHTNGGSRDTEGDLRMLCYFRGRERTLARLGELAATVGLELGSAVPADSRSVIELRPAR